MEDTGRIVNKAMCRKCGDIIESKHRHDMVWCKCGAIAVDGGQDYIKRTGDPMDFIDIETDWDGKSEIDWGLDVGAERIDE